MATRKKSPGVKAAHRTRTSAAKRKPHGNPHDFKRAKTKVLKKYAKRHALRPGTKNYNAYVYGSVSRRMAHK